MIMAVWMAGAIASNWQPPVPIELIVEEPMIVGQIVTDGGEQYRGPICEQAYAWNTDYYERTGLDARQDGNSYSNFVARVEVLLEYRKVPTAYHQEVKNSCNYLFHDRLYSGGN